MDLGQGQACTLEEYREIERQVKQQMLAALDKGTAEERNLGIASRAIQEQTAQLWTQQK
jgi:hypothetical protein